MYRPPARRRRGISRILPAPSSRCRRASASRAKGSGRAPVPRRSPRGRRRRATFGLAYAWARSFLESERQAGRHRQAGQVDAMETEVNPAHRATGPGIPRLAIHQEEVPEFHIDPGQRVQHRCPGLRLEFVPEDIERLEVDEVTDLMKAILHQTGPETHVAVACRGDPCESSDRAATRREIMPDAQRDRHAPQRRRLLDRQIVLIDPVAEFRVTADAGVADVEHDVCDRRDPNGNVAAERCRAEVGAVDGELFGDEVEQVTARERVIEPAPHAPRADWHMKQEAVARDLRVRRPRERSDCGGGQQQYGATSRPHDPPHVSLPWLYPTHEY